MPKTTRIILALTTALALTASTTATATATTIGWMVGGSLLTGSTPLATTAAVDENFKLKNGNINIECTGPTVNGVAVEIIAPNKVAAKSIEFTECKPTEGKCAIESSTIGTVPVLAESTLEGALAAVGVFKPEIGKAFTNLTFLGTTCALEGTQPVTGTQAVLDPTGQDEKTLQLGNAITLKEGELKVGAGNATLTGSSLAKLASGAPWSFL